MSAMETSTLSPTLRKSSTRSTRLPLPTLEMCSRPSRPGSSETNAPNAAVYTKGPRNLSPLCGGLGRGAVGRADVDRAVVLDRDLGAGLVLDRVDGLPLRADHHADLVDRDLHRGDPGRVVRHRRRTLDRLAHHAEDRRAGL